MDSLFRLYQKAFRKKVVMDNEEFAQSIAHISRDMTHLILKDMQKLGYIKIERKGRRIYDNKHQL